jgi:hypothetical protein
MNKRQIVLFSVFIVSLVLIGTGAILWSSEASIYYGFNYDYKYLKENGNWVTFDWSNNKTKEGMVLSVECYNRGLIDGNFNIVIELTNATFSPQTPELYTQINNSVAKFPLTLNTGEHQTLDVHFKVSGDVTHFDAKVSFESRQALIRSTEDNWGGVNMMHYFSSDSGNSFIIGGLLQ